MPRHKHNWTPDPPVREQICDKFPNKKRYPSLKQANFAILRSLKRVPGLRVYRCESCDGYHLTSKA